MKLTSIALAAALSLAAGASFAQPAPGPGAPDAARHWQRPDPAQMAQRHAEMAQRHAQHLRDALQLRPEQEPALQALLASMQPPAGAREAHGKRGEGAEHAMTTPERLDRMQARMAERADHFRQHAEATKRFYAALSPSQQKAFDAMPMMGHGEHGHGGMRGGPGMRGGEHGKG
ncbi:MAG: hypothetical protein E7812_16330 [Phenylobacterium sp.]|nr:MAG: hypothetical protein E7812_16330 [Phenylobacterium sp.]